MNSKIPFQKIALGVVSPMANEAENAERFVRDVLARITPFPFRRVRIYAVFDNACKDGTVDRLRALAPSIPELKVVWAPENRCAVDAYLRGYREAIGDGSDWILEIDAGFSHRPEDIPLLLQTMAEGYDCVFGSRFCPGAFCAMKPFKRWFISRFGSILANAILGTRLRDMTSGFELFTREALEAILARGIRSRGPFFQTEIKAYAHRFRIAEVPIHYEGASHNVGSKALGDAFANLRRLFQLRMAGALMTPGPSPEGGPPRQED